MSVASLLTFCLAMAFLSLIIVSAVNQRQSRARMISRQVAQMKRRVTELEDMVLTVDRLVDSADLARHLNEEVIHLIRSMERLDAGSQTLQVNLHNAEQLGEELRNPGRQREIYRLQESDSAIARALFQLNDAGRVLRKRQASGKLEVAQLEAFIKELAWAHLMVAVVSNVAQGHKALNRGDVLRAYAFYKKAQQVAMQTSLADDRRHRLIRELSDMLQNRRKSLSTDLMPETQFNPGKGTSSLPGMMDQPVV